jgi:sugar lactone lactonase YvrE
MEDLGVWKELEAFQQDGPRGIAFDSEDHVYFNNRFGIYRADLNGHNVEQLHHVEEPIIGNIAIDSNDNLFFTDSSEEGGVYRLEPEGTPSLVAKVPFAENLAFGPENSLFVTRTKSCPSFGLSSPSGCHASVAVAKKRTAIVKVDISTGRAVDFHYPNYWFFGDSIYITADAENNLWVRAKSTLYRLSPQGQDKPYFIFTDIVKHGYEYRYGPAGGVTFDDQGRIWLASGNSSLWRFNLPTEEEQAFYGSLFTETTYTRTLITPGIKADDLAIGVSGLLYAASEVNGELWRINQTGNPDVFSSYQAEGGAGWASLVVNNEDILFIGVPYGSILKVDQKGSRSSYAKYFTRSMTFGVDDMIYAVGGDVTDFKEIVQIDASGNIKTLAIDVDGTSLGKREVHIANAQADGFYVFREENSSLYFLDYDDNSHLISDLTAISGGGPVVMTSSPISGDIFLAPKDSPILFRIDPEGNSELFANGFIGRVSAMVVSPDGETLYIGEAGAINKISLTAP